jgi:hypothetical protein
MLIFGFYAQPMERSYLLFLLILRPAKRKWLIRSLNVARAHRLLGVSCSLAQLVGQLQPEINRSQTMGCIGIAVGEPF